MNIEKITEMIFQLEKIQEDWKKYYFNLIKTRNDMKELDKILTDYMNGKIDKDITLGLFEFYYNLIKKRWEK